MGAWSRVAGPVSSSDRQDSSTPQKKKGPVGFPTAPQAGSECRTFLSDAPGWTALCPGTVRRKCEAPHIASNASRRSEGQNLRPLGTSVQAFHQGTRLRKPARHTCSRRGPPSRWLLPSGSEHRNCLLERWSECHGIAPFWGQAGTAFCARPQRANACPSPTLMASTAPTRLCGPINYWPADAN